MLCNWPVAASNVCRMRPYRHGLTQWISATNQYPLVQRIATATMPEESSLLQRGCPNFIPRTSPSPLTEAQMSRAACRAVHKCLQLHSMGDAYYIVNSLRFTTFQQQKSLIKFMGVRSRDDFETAAMQFGRPVSPRLSSHALLHGLLRAGMTKKAHKLVRLMINDGIKLRSKSLEAIMHGFCSPALSKFTPARPIKSVPGHGIFKPQSKLASDEGTRMALSLLLLAQRSWHRRTRSMYRALLALCIINGELILGSLLFGYMIRDWQSQAALQAATDQPAQASPCSGQKPPQKCNSLLRERLQPSGAMLQSLLLGINANLEHMAEHEQRQESAGAALQSLAILANLLDDHQLIVTGLSPLICSLYRAPKLDHHVWIMAEGRPRRKRAHEYFHDVLRRLINSLPAPGCQHERIMLPAFDLSTYNALLNYALRHCSSPTLGNKVLHYMTNVRGPNLKPDITTYNILIRSGTALRDSSIAEQALSVLRRNPQNHILLSVKADEPANLSISAAQGLDPTWPDGVHIHEVPEMDSATLCAYIGYLTAIGQPFKAAQLLALLIPELRERRLNSSPDTRRVLREAFLKRAVQLGPHVFTAILTALCKAGKIGLAERVWLVALSAEKASSNPKYGQRPWSLPLHAYTVMMQCYGAQVCKHGHVVGWARPLSPINRVNVQRRIAALHLAQSLYRHAKAKFHGGMSSSQLDAQFFTAALEVFTRHPDTGRRTASCRSSYQRRRLARSRRRYVQFVSLSRRSHHNPMLHQILYDILDAGCEVPVAYHPMLVEHIPTSLQ